MFIHIDYELEFVAPFHFGTGVRTGLIDRTVIRDNGAYLYAPASTFKGVLREHCEHLCNFYIPSMQAQVASPHDAYAALADLGRPPDLLSRIFGSQIYPGMLFFSNARQREKPSEYEKQMQVAISTQVRIDRETRTSVDEALYTSEFGIRDLVFTGSIKGQLTCTPLPQLAVTSIEYGKEPATLTPTYSLLLLLAGMLLIERLGGNKSSGKGECHCHIVNVQLDGHTCTEEQWRGWIEHLDVLSDYPQDEKGARQ